MHITGTFSYWLMILITINSSMLSQSSKQDIQLMNDTLSICLDVHNGSIVSIYDKRINKEYVGVKELAGLFRFMIPDEEWHGRHIESNEQEILKIERIDDKSCVLHYSKLRCGGTAYDINASISLRVAGEDIRLRLKIINRDNQIITNVIFPWIGGIQEIEDRVTDAVYLPSQLERKIVNPLTAIAQNHYAWSKARLKKYYRYPYWLSSTWADYSNRSYGIAFDVRSNDFQMQDFYIEGQVIKDTVRAENNIQALSLGWSFHPHLAKNEEWETPDIFLKPHLGDWHTVSDEHRSWVESWIRKSEIPAEFAKGLGWHFYFMKHQDGTVVNNYDDLPRMAESALDAGINYILLFGWQQLGHDNYYPFGYYPNSDWGGQENLIEKLNEVRRLGCNVIPFSNFTLMDRNTKEYRDFAHDWSVRSMTGGELFAGNWAREDFGVPVRHAAWVNSSARSMLCVEMCLYDESLDYVYETAEKIYDDYGFGNLQLDQIGHKYYNCYNEKHKHEKPQKAFQRGISSLLENVKKSLRNINPEGVLIGEGFTELTAAYCDAHWTWHQLDFPEPLLYSIPWSLYSTEIDALEYAEVNKCFAYKIMLDLKIDGGDGDVNKYPAFARHLKKLADLKATLDPEFYVNAYFRDDNFISVTSGNNGVLAKVFSDQKGKKIGIVAVNTLDSSTGCAVTINDKIQSGKIRNVKFYHLDGKTEEKTAGKKFDLFLMGYDVNVICISLE